MAVEPKGRRRDQKKLLLSLDREAEADQDVLGVGGRNYKAQGALELTGRKLDHGGNERFEVNVRGVLLLAAGQLVDQLGGPIDRGQAERRAQSLFKPG